MLNTIFLILLSFSLAFADTQGTFTQGKALIEGFNVVASAAGTTNLTVTSETKQILTGTQNQTYKLPDATTVPLSRYFMFLNKSSGTLTVQDYDGNILGTVATDTFKRFDLRVGGTTAGTWDLYEGGSGGGGGAWGSITGTLSDQLDLQAALDLKANLNNPTFTGNIDTALTADRLLVSGPSNGRLTASSVTTTEAGYLSGVTGGIQTQLNAKAPSASPTFTGTITTPLTASRALVTGASSELAASAVTATQLGYLGTATSDIQTQLDAKQARSTLTTKGDLYVATASATVARQGVGADGQVLMSDSTQTNGVKWTTPTNDNLIFDGNAESGITNFVEGSYSAATRPSGTFTASSGAGAFAISTSSSSPLFGSNSFLLTKSSGASRQGRAIERTITIDAGYRTKMLKTRIDYTIVSGSFVAGTNGSSPTDSSLIWYVGQYNGSTWTYTEPSTFKMFSNSTTNSDWVEGEFQVNSDTTQLKLIGFISESANSAWVVKAEVGFRLSTFLAGTTITDWTSFSYTGFSSTNGVVSSKWRRVGDTMEVKQNVEWSNTAGAFTGVFGLPAGYSIDTSKIALNTLSIDRTILGRGQALDSGNLIFDLLVSYRDTTTVNVWSSYAAGTYVTNSGLSASAPFSFAANDTLNIYFSVPIVGWSSSVQQSDGYDGRFIGMRYTNSAGTAIGTSAAVLPYPTLVYDSTSSYNTSTGLYTCPATRYYNVQASFTTAGVSLTTTQGVDLYIRLNGTDVDRRLVLGNGASANYNANLPTTVYCQAGQTIGVYAVSSVATTTVTLANLNVLSIEAVQAPTTISATEFVGMSYSNTAGTTFTGTFSNVPFATKSYDSHNAWNGTDTYTCPVVGFYSVQAAINFTFGAYTAGHYAELNVTKNASTLVYANTWGANATVSNYLGLTASTVVQCNAGETIKLTCRNDASRALNTGVGYNTITITRIK